MTRAVLPALLILLGFAAPLLAQQSDEEIARRFAPVIYQEFSIYDGDEPLDYLRRVDYDGDWNTKNNLNNAEKKGVDNKGYVYFEVKETATHYFVTYYLYYARRAMIFNIKRENHSAGVVIVARKGAAAGKEIELLFKTDTGGDLDIVQTKNARSWGRNKIEDPKTGRKRKVSVNSLMAFDDEDIDPLRNHPRIHVDCWNHDTRIRRRPGSVRSERPYPFYSGRGIVYHPHSTVSHRAPTRGAVVVGYKLLPASEFEKIETLNESKTGMKGSKDHVAKLPGAWSVPAPGFPKGALDKDPARVVDTLFKGKGDFSRDYVQRGTKSGISDALGGSKKP